MFGITKFLSNFKHHSLYYFILLLHALSLIKHIQASPTCNNFPKIFGGTSADTSLCDMDVFKDYLGISSDTLDFDLFGITPSDSFASLPYIALMSISKTSKIYWAKGFPQKEFKSIYGLQFSPDGALLIAHSGGTNLNISP